MLIGLSQLLLAARWLVWLGDIANSYALTIGLGILSAFFGAVLIVAGAGKWVRLRQLILVIGLLSLATGITLIVNPALVSDILYAVVLNRSLAFQTLLVWIGGFLRIVVGVLLIYAVSRPPNASGPDKQG